MRQASAQSREFLTESVLGRSLSPYDRSIDTHVSNLRRKLAERKGVGIEIRNIRGAGYVLTGDRRATAMKTLFFRIFVSFWLAMILILAGAVAVTATVAWYRIRF